MRVFRAVATTAVLVGVSQLADAGDTKFYPGTMCQGTVFEIQTSELLIGTQRHFVHSLFTRPATHAITGAAYNGSSKAEMTMVCPIVRDVVRSDGLGWSSLFINVLNTSATRSLPCVAETFYKDDYGFGGMASNALPASRDWTDLGFSVLSVPVDGYTVIRCTVPRVDPDDYPAGIASYRIDE